MSEVGCKHGHVPHTCSACDDEARRTRLREERDHYRELALVELPKIIDVLQRAAKWLPHPGEPLDEEALRDEMRETAAELERLGAAMKGAGRRRDIERCRARGCGGHLAAVGVDVYDGQEFACFKCGRWHVAHVAHDGAPVVMRIERKRVERTKGADHGE